MESCSKQKSFKQIVYFRYFKVATLYLDDQLYMECFFNRLEGVPTCTEHLLAAFPLLCGPTLPKPSQLG